MGRSAVGGGRRHVLAPRHQLAAPGDTACIKIPITESEYYLVVNRVHDTNFDSLFTFGDIDSNFFPDNTDSLSGAEFDFFVTVLTDPFFVKPDPAWGGVTRIYFDTGTGMYIWHVDENVIRQMAATGHLPNDFVSQKGVDLEEADGVQDLDGLGDPVLLRESLRQLPAGEQHRLRARHQAGHRRELRSLHGVTVDEISQTGRVMTCRISFAPPYEETRTRWAAGGSYQPPSLVDLDDAGGLEIVVFADTSDVYAFDADGREFVDSDGNPETIGPVYHGAGRAVDRRAGVRRYRRRRLDRDRRLRRARSGVRVEHERDRGLRRRRRSGDDGNPL